MANLFWGVSDALDLYSEYISAKKQKGSKSEESNASKKHVVEPIETSNQANDNPNLEGLNNSTEKGSNVGERTLKTEHIDGLPSDDLGVCGTQSGVESSDDNEFQNVSHNKAVPKKLEMVPELDCNESAGVVIEAANADGTKLDRSFDQANRRNDEDTDDVHEIFSKHPSNITDMVKNTYQTVEKLNEAGSNTLPSNDSKETEEHTNKGQNRVKAIKCTEVDHTQEENIAESTLKVKEFVEHIEASNEDSQSECIKNRGASDGLDPIADNFKDTNTKNDNITTEAVRQSGGEDSNPFSKDKPPAQQDPLLQNSTLDGEEFEENKPRVLNILVFGGGDPRHVIKTMAKRYTHFQKEGTASSVPVLKFYLIDGCMEVVARNIVLLGIALERPEQMSLRNKVHLFMDVYGNTLIRPICHQYLVSKASMLLKMVSDSETLERIAPYIHIDSLKYREVDALQDAFEFWHPKPGYDFNIKDCWMSRLRRLLAVRYDARDGVFDWDLNMSLKDRGAQQICSQEYRYWRETGIAFAFPEYEQSKPNKTLAAGLVRNGGRYLHRGYVGDIQTGPFCTFGLKSLEERMLRSSHGENDYRATDVTERNLLEYFHEIQSGTPYIHNDGLSHKYGGVRFQMGERLVHNECDVQDICAYDKPWINVEGIEVHFLSLHDVKEVGKGVSKWENFFDVAFVGYKYFEFLTDSFPNVLRENSLLIMETKLRSVEIKSRIAEFETELQGFARDAKLESILNYSALNSKNSVLKFWKPGQILQNSVKKSD